jgi:hypothetical protein
MPEQNPAFLGEEQSPHLTASYAYVIEEPGGDRMFLTQWNRPITISGLPAGMGADDPQEFTPAPVRHGPVTTSDRFEQRSTSISLTTEDEAMRRFFTTAAPVRLKAWIIRLVGTNLATTRALVYSNNAIVVEAGILSNWVFKGNEIAVAVTPEAYHTDRAVPRFYFERQCNHQLYGDGCELDKEDFKWETTILSVNPAQREIILVGQAPGVGATRFSSGHFFHDLTGHFFTIGWSAHDGSNTKLKLVTWHPELAATNTVTAYHGCRHTTEDCAEFENEANYGGFPYVPNTNPTLNGVR